MITIKTPATSANVGPGFDTLGLALDLCNSFETELSQKDILDNVDPEFCNEDNLFLKGWHLACSKIGYNDHVHVVFHTEIPVSRGLGSSSSLIVAGVMAAFALHGNVLNRDEILQLSAEIEGHPDNVAPCIFGGFTASMKSGDVFHTISLAIDPVWKFTVFIPDFEVSTKKARAILPETYDQSDVTGNLADILYMTQGLATGNAELLRYGRNDHIHEPYRKKLLPFYEPLKTIFETETGGILLISGSGSTCIGIARTYPDLQTEEKIRSLSGNLKVLHLPLCKKGAYVL